jgi:beta-glucosidase
VSDFIWGLRDPVRSLEAGLDVEMPFAQQRVRALPEALESGAASWDDVDRSALRILATQLRFAAGVAPDPPGPDVVHCDEHVALAREVAVRSMVLLRNEPVDGEPVLPLSARSLQTLAVVGRLADVANTGDHGSSDVRSPHVVTALAGLRDRLPHTRITHTQEADPAVAAARDADAVVVVVGYTAADEGEYVGSFDTDLAVLYPPSDDPQALAELARVWDEGPQAIGGDRRSLRLHAGDEELVRAVAAVNPRTVVVVVAGATVTMEHWRSEVPAVLLAWYAGAQGGNALADVLLGEAEPGGRLPFAVPRDEADLPAFDPNATTVTYDAWHGQRLLDRDGVEPAYPLGFGLSYSRFEVTATEAVVDRAGGVLEVTAGVRNTGERPGSHVVQVYATRPVRSDSAPSHPGLERRLVDFARVDLAAGATRQLRFRTPLARLATREKAGRWTVPPGEYGVEVCSHAGDPDSVVLAVELS